MWGKAAGQTERRKGARRLEQDSETEGSSASEDADLAPDHPDALPLVAWASVCRRLRAILGRGQGNYHLDNAYARCGIHGRPKIMVPGNTRMIVYSSKFLRQSFAHFKARYEALCAWDIVLQGLAEDPSNKGRARHRKRRETIVRAGQRLARASHVLQAFLVHLCFSLPHGFIHGALEVQKTDTVFFLRTCVSIACVCTCCISGFCRRQWRGRRLEPLPRRRATVARAAQPQGSAALRAVCSKEMEQRWSRTSEANTGCQTAGRGGAILPKRCYYAA